VVLLEDLGALLGLVLALAGLTLTVVTDEPRFDGVGTLAIGILLISIAAILVVEMKSLLIGESATPAVRRQIEDAINGSVHVASLIHLRTEHIGPEELLVGAKVEFAGCPPSDQLVRAINSVESDIRTAVPTARVIYIEPDIQHAEATGADG
jgi:divalent metal cation (Fe/Co/Zn/Cd) transporter